MKVWWKPPDGMNERKPWTRHDIRGRILLKGDGNVFLVRLLFTKGHSRNFPSMRKSLRLIFIHSNTLSRLLSDKDPWSRKTFGNLKFVPVSASSSSSLHFWPRTRISFVWEFFLRNIKTEIVSESRTKLIKKLFPFYVAASSGFGVGRRLIGIEFLFTQSALLSPCVSLSAWCWGQQTICEGWMGDL